MAPVIAVGEITYCSLILISLIISDVEYVFTYLLAICTSSWRIVCVDLQAVASWWRWWWWCWWQQWCDNTVDGTSDTLPGALWVQSAPRDQWRFHENPNVEEEQRLIKRKKEGWNKEAETGQGTFSVSGDETAWGQQTQFSDPRFLLQLGGEAG